MFWVVRVKYIHEFGAMSKSSARTPLTDERLTMSMKKGLGRVGLENFGLRDLVKS